MMEIIQSNINDAGYEMYFLNAYSPFDGAVRIEQCEIS